MDVIHNRWIHVGGTLYLKQGQTSPRIGHPHLDESPAIQSPEQAAEGEENRRRCRRKCQPLPAAHAPQLPVNPMPDLPLLRRLVRDACAPVAVAADGPTAVAVAGCGPRRGSRSLIWCAAAECASAASVVQLPIAIAARHGRPAAPVNPSLRWRRQQRRRQRQQHRQHVDDRVYAPVNHQSE